MNSIECCDCGKQITGSDSVKELAKKSSWVHVAKGRWRCSECQVFQNRMNEQFGAEAEVIIPSRG